MGNPGHWDINAKKKISLIERGAEGKMFVAKNLFLIVDMVTKNMEIRSVNTGGLVYRLDFSGEPLLLTKG